MKRMMIFELAGLAVLLLLAGCRERDCFSGQIKPQDLRILSLVTAADHLLVELDCRDKIAAIDRHGRVLSAMSDVPVIAAGSSVSQETLRKYGINYAIIWYYQHDLAELLRREKIPFMMVEPLTLGNYPELIRQLGSVTGCQERAEELQDEFNAVISNEAKSDKRYTFYFELYAPWKTLSANGFTAQLIECTGGVMAIKTSRRGIVSPEAVALADPEVIFYVEGFGSADEIASRPALRNSRAVRNKHIYAVPALFVSEGVLPEETMDFFRKIADNI